MKNYTYLLVVFFLLAFVNINAQDEYLFERDSTVIENFYSYKKEIGLNFTPLISKLVPFNLSDSDTEIISLQFKKYGVSKAFRLNFGVSMDENSILDENYLYFAIGYEKRKNLSKRWNYTTGWDAFTFVQEQDNFQDSGLGVSKFYGFEFNINNNVFLGTHASFQFYYDMENDGFNVAFNVPKSLFLFMRF